MQVDLFELIDQHADNVDKTVTDVQNKRRSLEGNFVQLPSQGTEYDKNQRSYVIYENLITTLRQSKIELEIARAGTVPNSLILSPPNKNSPTQKK